MSVAQFVYTVLLKPRPLRRAANAAIRSLLPERVRVGDADVWLNPRRSGDLRRPGFGVYERGEIAFFRSRFRAGMTLVDVGANVGLYSALALSTPGFHGRVLALEPHAESRRYLEKTIAGNAPAPARRRSSASPLPTAPARSRSTRIRRTRATTAFIPIRCCRRRNVGADTLDNICRSAGIASAQFVKIDVQGAEAQVVRGAAGLLGASARVRLMTEFWPYGLARCGGDPLAYLGMLRELGFRLYQLPESGALDAIARPRRWSHARKEGATPTWSG